MMNPSALCICQAAGQLGNTYLLEVCGAAECLANHPAFLLSHRDRAAAPSAPAPARDKGFHTQISEGASGGGRPNTSGPGTTANFSRPAHHHLTVIGKTSAQKLQVVRISPSIPPAPGDGRTSLTTIIFRQQQCSVSSPIPQPSLENRSDSRSRWVGSFATRGRVAAASSVWTPQSDDGDRREERRLAPCSHICVP